MSKQKYDDRTSGRELSLLLAFHKFAADAVELHYLRHFWLYEYPSISLCLGIAADDWRQRFILDNLTACEITRRHTKTKTIVPEAIHKMAQRVAAR